MSEGRGQSWVQEWANDWAQGGITASYTFMEKASSPEVYIPVWFECNMAALRCNRKYISKALIQRIWLLWVNIEKAKGKLCMTLWMKKTMVCTAYAWERQARSVFSLYLKWCFTPSPQSMSAQPCLCWLDVQEQTAADPQLIDGPIFPCSCPGSKPNTALYRSVITGRD